MADEVENISPQPVVAQAGEKVLRLEREWPYRLAGGLVIFGTIALLAGIILTLKNDLVNKRIQEVKEEFYDWAGTQGLTLDDVVVTGRKRTTLNEINRLVDFKRGDNMLKIDVYDIKRKLETLPWVKTANVRRSFFPNVININLEEKEVRAIWQINEKFYPIDGDGKVIDANFRTQEPILLIVGAGDTYLQRIKVANFISQRRWNLILDDIKEGITVKLPEEDIEEAWKKLLKLNETKGILKRKLTIIDLRLPHKIVVKLRKTRGEPPVKLNNKTERKT